MNSLEKFVLNLYEKHDGDLSRINNTELQKLYSLNSYYERRAIDLLKEQHRTFVDTYDFNIIGLLKVTLILTVIIPIALLIFSGGLIHPWFIYVGLLGLVYTFIAIPLYASGLIPIYLGYRKNEDGMYVKNINYSDDTNNKEIDSLENAISRILMRDFGYLFKNKVKKVPPQKIISASPPGDPVPVPIMNIDSD